MVLNLCFFWAMECYVYIRLICYRSNWWSYRFAYERNDECTSSWMSDLMNELAFGGFFSISCPTSVRPQRHQPSSHHCGRSQSQQRFYLYIQVVRWNALKLIAFWKPVDYSAAQHNFSQKFNIALIATVSWPHHSPYYISTSINKSERNAETDHKCSQYARPLYQTVYFQTRMRWWWWWDEVARRYGVGGRREMKALRIFQRYIIHFYLSEWS